MNQRLNRDTATDYSQQENRNGKRNRGTTYTKEVFGLTVQFDASTGLVVKVQGCDITDARECFSGYNDGSDGEFIPHNLMENYPSEKEWVKRWPAWNNVRLRRREKMDEDTFIKMWNKKFPEAPFSIIECDNCGCGNYMWCCYHQEHSNQPAYDGHGFDCCDEVYPVCPQCSEEYIQQCDKCSTIEFRAADDSCWHCTYGQS